MEGDLCQPRSREENIVCVHHGRQSSRQREQDPVLCDDMDGQENTVLSEVMSGTKSHSDLIIPMESREKKPNTDARKTESLGLRKGEGREEEEDGVASGY